MTNQEYVKELRKVFKALVDLDSTWCFKRTAFFYKYNGLLTVLVQHTDKELNKFGIYND